MTDKKPSPQRTALLVHCHSEADSFVTAMRNTVAAQLEQQGYAILHSDLYAMNFNPVLSPADFPERTDPDHLVYALEQRNGFKTGSLAPDILAEVEKVEAADLIVFTFPLFWFSVPALLKGWIDRVFLSGPFYGGKRFYDQGGMKGKRALTAFSLGGHEGLFGTDGIHGDLETGMLRPFLQGALGYVGFDVLEPFVAYHVPYISVEERTGILQNLKDALQSLEERPSLAMPSLARLRTSVTGAYQSRLSRHTTSAAGCAVFVDSSLRAILLSRVPSAEVHPGACFGPWSARWPPT